MENGYYKINEVAKMHNMSKKALIYYDKIGIFKPKYVDEKNNYRYYDIKEFPILKQIIYLKQIGFSLEEIKNLLEHRDHDVIINALTTRNNEIMKEIQKYQDMNNSIEYLLKFYKTAKYYDKRDLYKPSIKIFHQRKIFYLKCEEEASREEIMLTYRRVLKRLQELNLFSHQEYGTIYLKEGIKSGFKHNVGAFISTPENFHIKEETILPEGKYICMYKTGGYYDEESIKYLLKWIDENEYEVLGDIYEYSLIDYTFTKSVDKMVSELQIRVK